MPRLPRLVVCCFAFVLLIYVPLFGQERDAAQLSDFSGREIFDELQMREVAAVGPSKKGGYDWARNLSLSSFTRNPLARLEAEQIFSMENKSKLKQVGSQILFHELRRRAINKGIFGPDDRQDLFRLEARRNELIANGANADFFNGALLNANATCCLIRENQIFQTGSGNSKLFTTPFSESQHDTLKLCPSERFFSQPIGSFCTGFLVASDVVVTAGHCIDASNISGARFVFGFRMTDENTPVTSFTKDQVYGASAIIDRKLDAATGEDWAVVRLNRAVVGVTPLKFRQSGKIADSEKVYVIGYPSGLPCKVSDNATVNQNNDGFVFTSNLDTYAGNSGSPVFNRVTHEVEGILVRGGEDFKFVTDVLGGCIQSVMLSDAEGNEACTRSTVWASKIP
jgi:hypothetical protein